jgi:osmotically-inducible protein OsmY
MRYVKVFAAALLMAASAPASEPQAAKAPVKAPATASAKTPAPVRMSDAQLETAIRARFARSKINADKFQVRVQGGVATIEGKTDVIQHKGVATRMSRNAGAIAVNNRVQISEAARDKAAANLEKGRRRAQIKRAEPRSDLRPPR